MLHVRTILTGVTGTPWYVNMYADGNTAEDVGFAHARVVAFWSALQTALVTPIVATVQGDVAVIDPLTGDTTAYASVPPVTRNMTSGSDALPYANQVNVRLNTGVVVNNRRLIGRLLIPGSNELQTNGGLYTNAVRSFFDGVAEDLCIDGTQGRVGVWSRPIPADNPQGYAPRNGTFALVTGVQTQPAPAILRSRRD